MIRLLALAVVLGLAPAVAAAQTAPVADSGAFVVRMGTDTLAVERFVRTGDRIEGSLVRRDNPFTATRDYTAELNPDGSVRRLVVRLHTIGLSPTPSPYTFTYDYGADSARSVYDRPAENEREERRVALGGPVMAALGHSHALQEQALRMARGMGADSVRLLPVGANGTVSLGVRRGGGDTLQLATVEGPATAWVDARGRLMRYDGTRTLTKVTAERVGWIDVPALAADFARRDHEGRGIGRLSPRDSVQATVGGARVSVGYGRPSMRGRKIFGGILPWGRVWRTGANVTTQLTTDRALVIGGTPIPAGTYSLYTLPQPDRWTLIVNRKTGESGREDTYDPAQDVARIPMRFRALDAPVETLTIRLDPEGDGAVLRVAWETTEAWVPVAAP
ncbi:MAG TPA: DUF2911 domain-containing protein [Longimicrobium sp.]|nr:DUF2911 domain-containing protein [Longimicrobium sp.]